MLNARLFTRRIQRLSLAILLLISFSANGQQGYNWTFATSSIDENGNKYFSSAPALTGSTANYALTVMGIGTFTTGVSDSPGVGSSCTSPIPVASYPNYTGLEFLNGSPQLVSTTYTIELTINQGASEDYKRLISFYDLGGAAPENDYGIYVTPGGDIQFRTGSPYTITGSALSANSWYHLAFTRSSSGVISYYKNGTLVGTYTDSGNHFIPHSGESSYNIITFLKDNEGEDSHGKVARIGIYDAVLTATQIQANRDKVCEAIPEELWQTGGNFGTNTTHFIGTKNNQPLIFKTNNTEAFRITPTGQIGIGVATVPNGYKAAIGGSVIAEKLTVKLQGSWPDYVFDEKYRLRSLNDVEKFVRKNKHLPEMPSAKETETKGIDVGVQQTLLLKKIEELTLYIIELNKKVDELKKENTILRRSHLKVEKSKP